MNYILLCSLSRLFKGNEFVSINEIDVEVYYLYGSERLIVTHFSGSAVTLNKQKTP